MQIELILNIYKKLNKNYTFFPLLSYFKWVSGACIIGLPFAWLISEWFLRTYVYRIKLQVWDFLLPALLAFVIALLTVGIQTYKAASKNPADAMRYE